MTAVAFSTRLKRFAASAHSRRAAKGDLIGLLVRSARSAVWTYNAALEASGAKIWAWPSILSCGAVGIRASPTALLL